MGEVGDRLHLAFSIVTPNALASMPGVTGGSTSVAEPAASGRNSPAGTGALPFAGISQSS